MTKWEQMNLNKKMLIKKTPVIFLLQKTISSDKYEVRLSYT